MKVKKLLAGILSVAMVLGTMAFPASAADDWGDNCVVARGIAGDGSDVYYKTLAEALHAVYMSNPTSAVSIDCKAGANVGSMSHAHVADDIVINGNGATVSGVLEIDMYTYSRETGKNVTSGGEYLKKDIIVKVNDLNGVAAWGQRHTGNTITLEFNNCQNMQEVMFRTSPVSDDIGSMNITLNGCSFDVDNGAVKGTSVHVTSAADIKVKNCTFKGVAAPINLNNKSTKAQTLNVEGCTFTDCAEEAATKALDSENDKPSTYAAPIRCVTTQETGTIKAAVKDCTFTNCSTIGHGDILLGDGRVGKASTNGAQVTVSGTASTVKTEFPGAAEKTNTVEVKADDAETTITMQEASTAVARIGAVEYETLTAAITAAQSGDVIELTTDTTLNADFSANKADNFVLTIKGNGHKISTGVIESQIDGNPRRVPTIGIVSANGSLTVDNIVAPENLEFKISGTAAAFADSLTIKNCTMNGSILDYMEAVKHITYDRNRFIVNSSQYNKEHDVYPVWYKFQGKEIETFKFTNNEVDFPRGVQLSNMPENMKVIVTGNTFNIHNMLPMRAMYETLGAQVTWKDADKIIFATKANKFITMKIGVPKVVVQTTDSSENAVIELDCGPVIDSGYTLIPVRAAAEALDARVDWSEDTRTANIVTK